MKFVSSVEDSIEEMSDNSEGVNLQYMMGEDSDVLYYYKILAS